MGCGSSTHTITPRDLERWSRQGHRILTDQRRRKRSRGGRMHDEVQRGFTRGGSLGGLNSDGGHRWPRLGCRGGLPDIPLLPGVHPDPMGGPDFRIGPPRTGLRGPPRYMGRSPVFDEPWVFGEEDEYDFIPSGKFFRDEGIPLGRPPPFEFGYPDNDPFRRAHSSYPGPYFFEDLFPPRRGGFDDRDGPFVPYGFGRGPPPPFAFDVPDDEGPARRGRDASPGFVFAEDGVPLRETPFHDTYGPFMSGGFAPEGGIGGSGRPGSTLIPENRRLTF